MLEAKSVFVEVDGRSLLTNVSMRAQPGEILVICGPNGAGKSTLLKALSGELKPSAGQITLDGENVATMQAWQLATRRAVVPQATHLAFPFTVAEVVSLGLTVPGFAAEQNRDHQAVREALFRVDLHDFAHRSYLTLSGGERQRVHLARALCQLAGSNDTHATCVLFLDEPTASLDLAHQLLILQEARRIADSGTIVIAVLHDLNLAAAFADKIAVIRHGRLVCLGPPGSVMTSGTLSLAFECHVRPGQTPPDGMPYVLPQRCSLPRRADSQSDGSRFGDTR